MLSFINHSVKSHILKFMFSKEATKIDEIFIVDLTLCSKCQIDRADFVNFCGLLGKLKLWINKLSFRVHLNPMTFFWRSKLLSSYILRRPQNFVKSPPIICLMFWQSNNWWRFRKILWPSQNIWTLHPKN